jgi:hypothetical protein
MIKKLSVAIAAIGCLAASPASALSFDLGGYSGAIKIKFSNWENFTTPVGQAPAPGDENYGILKITTIESDDGNNTTLWTSGQGGAELTGVFRDIIVDNVTLGATTNIQSSGGVLDVFLNPVGAFAAAGGANQGTGGYAPAGCAIGDDCYNGITNVAGGLLFLSLEWASGIDPTDSDITIDGDLQGNTVPGTGDAAGFLNVTGGAYASTFDTNGQATAFGNRDMFTQNDFCVNGQLGCAQPAQGDWQLVSEDPVRAFVVPEPGLLSLFGIGLVGCYLRRRRA